jgi:hypothetical protein
VPATKKKNGAEEEALRNRRVRVSPGALDPLISRLG